MTGEQDIKTLVTVLAAQTRNAEGRVNDAVYWAKSAIADAEKYVTTSGGGGFNLSNDLVMAMAELRSRRGALHEAMKLAKKLGVDVETEVGYQSLAYVPEVGDDA